MKPMNQTVLAPDQNVKHFLIGLRLVHEFGLRMQALDGPARPGTFGMLVNADCSAIQGRCAAHGMRGGTHHDR